MKAKVPLGQIFSEYFGLPCHFSFHPLLHTHYLSSGAGTIGQSVANIPSGLSLTPPQEEKEETNPYSIRFIPVVAMMRHFDLILVALYQCTVNRCCTMSSA
jgi:hypothetical protein